MGPASRLTPARTLVRANPFKGNLRSAATTVARGKKEDCEVSAGRALLADPQVQLVNALVTADPLHNKTDTVRVILEKGGDYLIGTKENTSQRLAGATQALTGTPFLS